eukprot:403360589
MSQPKVEPLRELSRNALRRIFEATEALKENFTFQVIEIKRQPQIGKQDSQVVKLKLSDGISCVYALYSPNNLSFKANKVPCSNLTQYCIVEIKDYIKKITPTHHCLIIKEEPKLYQILKLQIGDPIDYAQRNEKGDFESFKEEFEQLNISIPAKPIIPLLDLDQEMINEPKLNMRDMKLLQGENPEECLNPFSINLHQDLSQKTQEGQFAPDYFQFTPISALSQNSQDWRIKARITKKYEMRQYTQTRRNGEKFPGKILNIDLIDGHGAQIMGTFFNDTATRFDSKIKENKVYTISGGQIKLSNQKFTAIKNEFCLIFTDHSEFKEAVDDESIQSVAFSFVSIQDIKNMYGNKTIDFIGIAQYCQPVKEKQLKSGTKAQRTVYLADESNQTIALCIWGDLANQFDLSIDEHPVIAVKRANLSEFGGRSLNSNEDSQVIVNPSHPRTQQLKHWFNHLADPSQLSSITVQKEKGEFPEEKKSFNFDNQRFLGEIMEALYSGDKSIVDQSLASYFYVSAYIWILKNDDRTYYLACPNDDCKRKVIEESVGWRCQSCDRTYQTCIPTYMLSAKLADASDAQFINFYKQEGTLIMGLPADKLKEIKDQGDIQVINDTFSDRQFRKFGLIVKPKQLTYQNNNGNNYGQEEGAKNFRLNCTKVMEHSWQIENQMILSRLKLYEKAIGYERQELELNQKQRKQFSESQKARRQNEFVRQDEEIKRIKLEQLQLREKQQMQK